MVGLMPTWEHMLRKKLLEDYVSWTKEWCEWHHPFILFGTLKSSQPFLLVVEDWVINSESEALNADLDTCVILWTSQIFQVSWVWFTRALQAAEVGPFSESQPCTFDNCQWRDWLILAHLMLMFEVTAANQFWNALINCALTIEVTFEPCGKECLTSGCLTRVCRAFFWCWRCCEVGAPQDKT